jgi:hypothetical protein
MRADAGGEGGDTTLGPLFVLDAKGLPVGFPERLQAVMALDTVRESGVGGRILTSHQTCVILQAMNETASHTLIISQAVDPDSVLSGPEGKEERIVAELGLLGIRYLSRRTAIQAERLRSPDTLLVDLIRQPSARVRSAVIAVLLAHSEYAAAVPAALEQLGPTERLTLQLFYTAAVLLQQEHAERLRAFVVDRLPDQFSAELGLPETVSPRERLEALGRQHRQRTQAHVNWTGTYESVVQHLLRSWELEARWNQ